MEHDTIWKDITKHPLAVDHSLKLSYLEFLLAERIASR
jgi:hypothetical protein